MSGSDIRAWRAGIGGDAGSVAVVVGTFHILHPGNLAAVRLAKGKCDHVCVVLDPDDAMPAGGRPFTPLDVRTEMVSCLKDVDMVASFPRGDAPSRFAALHPYTLFSCEGQADGPLAKAAASLADRHARLPFLARCSTPEILSAIRDGRTPIKVPQAEKRQESRPDCGIRQPAKCSRPSDPPHVVVSVNGCFDVLHIGHIRFLAQARAMGDELVVLINNDISVRRYKGPDRPVFSLAFRTVALLALEPVSRVIPFAEDNPLEVLSALKPGIHVKGGSYEAGRAEDERKLVESWGGRLEFCALTEGHSTTGYLGKVAGVVGRKTGGT
jgi:rfaE bifunctional protein nucleotidyltransferase chain/domain